MTFISGAVPCFGLIVHVPADKIVPKEDIERLVERLQAQKGITIDYDSIKNANHFLTLIWRP